MDKYKICIVKYGGEIGTRPAVIIKEDKDSAYTLKITSRNRVDDKRYARLNNYIVSGLVNCYELIKVNKKKSTTSKKVYNTQ